MCFHSFPRIFKENYLVGFRLIVKRTDTCNNTSGFGLRGFIWHGKQPPQPSFLHCYTFFVCYNPVSVTFKGNLALARSLDKERDGQKRASYVLTWRSDDRQTANNRTDTAERSCRVCSPGRRGASLSSRRTELPRRGKQALGAHLSSVFKLPGSARSPGLCPWNKVSCPPLRRSRLTQITHALGFRPSLSSDSEAPPKIVYERDPRGGGAQLLVTWRASGANVRQTGGVGSQRWYYSNGSRSFCGCDTCLPKVCRPSYSWMQLV